MSMQKKFGQNFLINGNARRKIIDALDIHKGNTVWEVGPGLGAMTQEIISRGVCPVVFEIDRGFCGVLEDMFEQRIRLVSGDVLKSWKRELEEHGLPDRFFGNLPYNIAAALIADTIEHGIRFERVVVTVQKEVALRMTARPGSNDYSSFSVLCQWAYDVSPVMDLSGGSFWPRPNVDSRTVVMTKKTEFPGCLDPGLFMKLQRALFSSRRKTVRNNLIHFLHDQDKTLSLLNTAGIDSQERAENLNLTQLTALADAVYHLKA
jgi:16S rRNA (adenine1518-N6/adenine1519-N6)-dimethyltransferase